MRSAIINLERQGIGWADVLVAMAAIAKQKGDASKAAILEDAARKVFLNFYKMGIGK